MTDNVNILAGGQRKLDTKDLWRLLATELAKLIKSKEVSATEAATAALARLDAVNPRINAVVNHKPADILAQASKVDAAIARGEQLGELAGVPVTVKINIDQEGFATTNGLRMNCDNIAKYNNPGPQNPAIRDQWPRTAGISATSKRTSDTMSRTPETPTCSSSTCSKAPIPQIPPCPTGFPVRHR